MTDQLGPKDFWQVKKEGNLKFNEALKQGDKRYIDLNKARGENVYNRLLKPLGFDNNFNPKLIDEDDSHYILFCGHRGCGKSTELNRVAKKLHCPDGYFVIQCNILEDLDINNIEYVDILFLVARKLAEQLNEAGISVDKKHIADLQDFFQERIINRVKSKDFEASITAGLSTKLGLKFIGEIFANLTTAFKTSSTYKEEVRRLVKNQFSMFKTTFNRMLDEIKQTLIREQKGKNLLVIIDGTDRLTRENCDDIFINHASQLTQLDTNFIYTVPIHLVYESNQVRNFYEAPFVLPNVILEKRRVKGKKTGWDAMKELIYRRIHPDLFDSEKTVNYIIKMSGGHLRELLHILQEAFNASDTETFDRKAVNEGIDRLKADYMRILNSEDYKRLVKLDKENDKESDDIMKNLLFNSVVLEYNDYWRAVSPIVKATGEFKKFFEAHENETQFPAD
ncbi:MAG: AAA family ATPase [bacterium]|nr:AAA family ATPase [bacterium]